MTEDHDLLIKIEAAVSSQGRHIADLAEQVKTQNGSVAEVKTGLAVLQGQFGLARWIVGIIAIPVLLAAIAQLSGYAF